MFTSTKSSHLLILQEIRALKDEIAEMNQEMADQQTAQFMAEIDQLKAQLTEIRQRWSPPPLARPRVVVPPERTEPRIFDAQNRQ